MFGSGEFFGEQKENIHGARKTKSFMMVQFL